jgi:hypothetical protein
VSSGVARKAVIADRDGGRRSWGERPVAPVRLQLCPICRPLRLRSPITQGSAGENPPITYLVWPAQSRTRQQCGSDGLSAAATSEDGEAAIRLRAGPAMNDAGRVCDRRGQKLWERERIAASLSSTEVVAALRPSMRALAYALKKEPETLNPPFGALSKQQRFDRTWP